MLSVYTWAGALSIKGLLKTFSGKSGGFVLQNHPQKLPDSGQWSCFSAPVPTPVRCILAGNGAEAVAAQRIFLPGEQVAQMVEAAAADSLCGQPRVVWGGILP